ncbi:T9SS type A sorting domain-containing protein [Lacinutrix sp. C3R15]|uniref:T9SS type A sorting domain-containing protein n=1 Tax=Flavobacteriaceae TaxID=49546 RepID=UPI001C094D2F|nr:MULTISPECIES: T9SS type A sorting domain-containing protein [Flavobacteriaceae]MBU2940086.1 T9SS type A sorting domain-containing protein [Lacinutrix sp. C3R15]MDO6623403.1 T9SS type A sorting domain-containing protein [Oceanihabitans sp. 1_MG-2023]
MKKNIIFLLFFVLGVNVFAQTITLNACHYLLETADYTFNQKSLDATGRNTFETNPVDENSPCGGLGNCELQIAWNNTVSRWEIFADDGNGTFENTYVLYYNSSASLPNPPSLNLGSWVEETSVTETLCGAIISITGDVQDTTLSVENLELDDAIMIHPNPVKDILFVDFYNKDIDKISLYNILGKHIYTVKDAKTIDVSKNAPGLYFVKIIIGKKKTVRKIIIE